jgi:CBS domain-containing protein
LRTAILTLALVFAGVIGVFTGRDIARYGLTPPGVLGALIVVLFMIGILGALSHPPDQ